MGKPRIYRCTSLWHLTTGGTGGARETAVSLNGWLHGVGRLSRGWESSRSMFADAFSITATWEPCVRGGEPTYWHACIGDLEVETTSRANKPRKLLLERAWRLWDRRLLLMSYTVTYIDPYIVMRAFCWDFETLLWSSPRLSIPESFNYNGVFKTCTWNENRCCPPPCSLGQKNSWWVWNGVCWQHWIVFEKEIALHWFPSVLVIQY